jgi:hypothetical protein
MILLNKPLLTAETAEGAERIVIGRSFLRSGQDYGPV